MKQTREEIIEECARVCDQHAADRLRVREILEKVGNDQAANNFGMEFQAARHLAAAIRALSRATPTLLAKKSGGPDV